MMVQASASAFTPIHINSFPAAFFRFILVLDVWLLISDFNHACATGVEMMLRSINIPGLHKNITSKLFIFRCLQLDPLLPRPPSGSHASTGGRQCDWI